MEASPILILTSTTPDFLPLSLGVKMKEASDQLHLAGVYDPYGFRSFDAGKLLRKVGQDGREGQRIREGRKKGDTTYACILTCLCCAVSPSLCWRHFECSDSVLRMPFVPQEVLYRLETGRSEEVCGHVCLLVDAAILVVNRDPLVFALPCLPLGRS